MVTQNDLNNGISVRGDSKLTSLLGVLLIFIAIGFYIFFVRGLNDKTSELKASVLAANQQIGALNKQITDFTAAEKEMGVASSVQRLELEKAVPVGIKQDEVIKQLVEISDMNSISLSSIGFGRGASTQNKIGTLQINASFEGTYDDLVQFLEGLEQNRRTFRVNSISVQITDLQASDVKKANFSLSMEAFYQ